MIWLQASGRLGNQMFHYAFARDLMIKYPEYGDLIIYFPSEKENIKWNGNQLAGFNTIDYKVVKKCSISLIQKGVCNCYRLMRNIIMKKDYNKSVKFCVKYQRILNKFGIYSMLNGAYLAPFKSNINNVWICGMYENPKYFDNIKNVLIEEFTPKSGVNEYNKKLYKKICESNSVCLSVRKGDFLAKGNEKFNICSNNYYYSAVEIMKTKVKDMNLFIFSDDIEWCKENLKFDVSMYFENNNGNDSVSEKMRLMYSCKNFIISNSSFSWWAQYLCRNEKKIVIAPKPWRKDIECDCLYDRNFILLDSNGKQIRDKGD